MSYPIVDNLRANIGDPAGKSLADIEHAQRHDETHDALRELRDTGWRKIYESAGGSLDFTFSSPEFANYELMKITITEVRRFVGATSARGYSLRINGDAGNNYAFSGFKSLNGVHSALGSNSSSSIPLGDAADNDASTGNNSTCVVLITARADKPVNVMADASSIRFSNSIQHGRHSVGGGWNSVAPITSFTVVGGISSMGVGRIIVEGMG